MICPSEDLIERTDTVAFNSLDRNNVGTSEPFFFWVVSTFFTVQHIYSYVRLTKQESSVFLIGYPMGFSRQVINVYKGAFVWLQVLLVFFRSLIAIERGQNSSFILRSPTSVF